ncbi:hypothetical protein R4P64_03400 [Rhodococcus sp. IEGM 1366]|uniref:hypothetical protein n=1 Tax=Rhodococcus sp. IEGM 1366 TaxID=3082223 RepID=UPI002953D74C|nr:hypothetical protein [Rhodococcus sp. IEGM 1366]MDV8065544.1 hypothetical protein [Rhodococcus sp. IEGM 1366]
MTDTAVTEDLWTRILEALALPAEADVETVVAALEDLVTTPPADPKAVAAAAGLTALDPAVVAQLQSDAQQGRVLAAAARKREVTDQVDAALRRGAITPARRQHWIDNIEADPVMASTLAKIPNEFAIALTPIGHGVGDDDKGGDIVEPAPWFR